MKKKTTYAGSGRCTQVHPVKDFVALSCGATFDNKQMRELAAMLRKAYENPAFADGAILTFYRKRKNPDGSRPFTLVSRRKH